jgi:two-component sensor histidine kinase/Tfp pilus assembly protein PilF
MSSAFWRLDLLFLTLVLVATSYADAQKADSVLATLGSVPDTAKIRHLNLIATQSLNRDVDLSRELAEKAVDISRQIGFQVGEANGLRVLGGVLMRQGKFKEAMESCRQAETIYAEVHDRGGTAEVLNAFGMIYSQQGQYPLALENFTKSLTMQRELNHKQQIPMTIENIGIIHFRQGDFQLALEFFKECHQAYLDQGNEGAANKILVNLGATYNKLAMPRQALESHLKSLDYFEKSNSVVGMGIAYNNIGGVYYMLENYPKAIENYSKSLEQKKKVNDKRGTSVSLANLAESRIMTRELDKALKDGLESLSIAEQIGSMEQVKVASELLSQIYEAKGNYRSALLFERKTAVAKDSLFSVDKTTQISRMRAIYETEKAEQAALLTQLQADIDIARNVQERNLFIVVASLLLVGALMTLYLYRQKRRSNFVLSEKNQVIEKSLAERETLLKEIHHRVKNNLQIISSLLSLQSKTLQDTGAQGAISESRNRVKSMSLIHEQLYQENTMSGVDMKDYALRLVNSLADSYGVDRDQIGIEVKAEPVWLDVDSAIPLGLIMNELVSNSMKYAFPAGRTGCIRVSIEEGPDTLRLQVYDDGIGMTSSAKNGEASFGLSMVRSLMRKLKAEMTIDSDAGTSVNLVIREFRKVTFA